jgi:hypothetical protein
MHGGVSTPEYLSVQSLKAEYVWVLQFASKRVASVPSGFCFDKFIMTLPLLSSSLSLVRPGLLKAKLFLRSQA